MPNNHSLQSENLAKLKEVLDKRYYGTSPFTNLDSTDEGKVIGVVKNRQGEYEAKPVSMNPASCPIGSIIAWPTPTIPVGFLVCNGQAVSRVSFKKLFDKIGITYGAGDGSTTFNVPDLRDKFIEGGNTSDANLDTAIAAGLPNITGTANQVICATDDTYVQPTGAFKSTVANVWGPQMYQTQSTLKKYGQFNFKASDSNTTYGKSTTVQPPAIKMLYIICTGDSTPESIVDSMQLANTDGNSTIKFGKDNLGNYGYYKGDDPTFNPFINPGDISATYELLAQKNAPTASETLTLIKSIADYDCALIECIDGNDAHWDGMIHKPAYNTTVMIERGNGSNECIRANINGTTCTVSVSGWSYRQYKIYGVKFRAEIEPPTSMKLSTDLTKEIRFGQEDGDNGYYVDDDTFIPFREGGQTLYHHNVLAQKDGTGSFRAYFDIYNTSATPLNTLSSLTTALGNYTNGWFGFSGSFSSTDGSGLTYYAWRACKNGDSVDCSFGGPSGGQTLHLKDIADLSIVDSVKVIGAAAVSSLPTAPSSGMFLMSNSTGEGEWSNAAVPPTPTSGQRVLTSNSNGTSAWTYFDPTVFVNNSAWTPVFNTSSDNVDNIMVNSTYNVNPATCGGTHPFNAWYFLVTMFHSINTSYGVQLAYSMTSDTAQGYAYYRRKGNGNWSTWTRIDAGASNTTTNIMSQCSFASTMGTVVGSAYAKNGMVNISISFTPTANITAGATLITLPDAYKPLPYASGTSGYANCGNAIITYSGASKLIKLYAGTISNGTVSTMTISFPYQ